MQIFEQILTELDFRTSKSSGPGGQHVNKVSTRVTLLFSVADSSALSDNKKELILGKLKNRISNDGILSLSCDETRSQSKNKEIVLERFKVLIENAVKPVKKGKPTKPTKSSIEKRLKLKKQKSDKKSSRKQNTDD